MLKDEQQSLIQMDLDYDGGHILYETVRWSRFVSIVGIVALGLYLLLFALAGTEILAAVSRLAPGTDELGGTAKGILITVLLLCFGYVGLLVFMLYRFSTLTRRAIDHQDQATFARGIKCLTTYFMLYAIFGILMVLANCYSLIRAF